MKILFVHSNYPAQFRNLAIALGSNPTHKVIFLSGNPKPPPWRLPGVTHLAIQEQAVVNTGLNPFVQAVDLAIRNGQSSVRALAQLKSNGFEPDLIINHAGTGYGLFIKDIFPNAKLVSYFEWFFRDHTLRESFPAATTDQIALWKRVNMTLLEELESCDVGVVPTSWQLEQLPKGYRKKLHTIFDGIATDFFHPAHRKQRLLLESLTNRLRLEIDSSQRLITYATRGMEPIRGFPEFMRLIPHLLEQFQDALVVIAGEDRSCYGPPAPSHGGSWREKMLDELHNDLKNYLHRIQFIGSLAYPQYRDLLCRSDLHCYFTRPYVPSWSLFETAACGSNLLTNRCPATADIVSSGKPSATDLDNPDETATAAISALSAIDPSAKEISNSYLPEKYSLDICLKQWEELLTNLVGATYTAT